MKQRIFSIILVIALISGLVVFSGCGKKQEKVIKIGAILPLTGPAAEWGLNQKQGMELAIEEINKSFVANNKKVVMVVEDDQSDPKAAVNAFNKIMLKDKPSVILTLQSSVSMALAPLANKNKVVLIASAAHPDLLKSGKYTFRCYPTSSYITETLVKKAVPDLGIKEFYILYLNDDYGVSMKDMFEQLIKKQQGKVIGVDSFEKDQSDFRSQISKLLSKRTKALYIPGYGKALGKLLKQLKEMNYKGRILATQEVSYNDVLSIAGEAANGIIYVDMPFDSNSKKENIQKFMKTFLKKYGKKPILDAFIGYDITNMTLNVIEKNGYSADKIREGLLGVKEFYGLLGNLKMSPSREVMYPLVLKTIKNGKPTLYKNQGQNE